MEVESVISTSPYFIYRSFYSNTYESSCPFSNGRSLIYILYACVNRVP